MGRLILLTILGCLVAAAPVPARPGGGAPADCGGAPSRA